MTLIYELNTRFLVLLTGVSLICAKPVKSSEVAASTNADFTAMTEKPCEMLLEKLSPTESIAKLVSDRSLTGIPLHRLNNSYLGYEFMSSTPIFADPDLLRQYINGRSAEVLEYNGCQRGQLRVKIHAPDQPSKTSILDRIRKYVPQQFAPGLVTYVSSVLEDAAKRNHKFHRFALVIRTEQFPEPILNGHHHGHSGDLNYVRVEIGYNTEVDSFDRHSPVQIREEDYTSGGNDRRSVMVFGDVWHRSPKPTEKRLWILVSLIPNRGIDIDRD